MDQIESARLTVNRLARGKLKKIHVRQFKNIPEEKLCEAPYNKTVDWAKWYIFWADERVVAKNHVDSNYKLAKDRFLSKGLEASEGSQMIRVFAVHYIETLLIEQSSIQDKIVGGLLG